jgi:hypothetical protein
MLAMLERNGVLLRAQRATEGSICVVQDMKAQLLRERQAKRERELAFLQSRAAPLASRLADLCGERGGESLAAGGVLDDEGLRAVVREALQRGREAELEGRAMSSRLCTGASVQRSACGRKMRIVLDASHCGFRLERYAVILQLRVSAAADSAETAAPNGRRATKARRQTDHAESPGSAGERANESLPEADGSSNGTSGAHERCDRGGRETGGGQSEESWTVVEHSLPKFVPVMQLATRLLPGNLRSFVVHVKDYLQALVARREQWQELLLLYAPASCAAPEENLGAMVNTAQRSNSSCVEISSPRVSDAYDSLSYTLRVAWTVPAEKEAGGAQRVRCCRVQLQYDDLRRCSPSSAWVEGVDQGEDTTVHFELLRGAGSKMQALLLAPGQRLADAVPRMAETLALHACRNEGGA